MTKEEIQSIFGSRIVSFHAVFAKAIGSVPAAVMLSQAFFWQEKAKSKDGVRIGEEMFFSKTGEEWYDETGLTESQQLTARKHLLTAGFWIEQRAGLPAKMCYRIDVEALVAVISRYLKTGQQVAVDNRHKLPQNTRDSSGKFRQLEAAKNGNNIKVENKGEVKGELEREQNEKNSPSTAELSSLEAEKNVENDSCAGAGPTLVEIHDAAHPDIPVFDIVPPAPVTQPPTNRIGLGDRPNAETPVQLESALREFYTDWPNEWSVGILENGRGKKYDASKQVEIVKDFCCWAVDHNRQRDTFGQLNARLQAWFRNEQHSTWKQAKPGQPGNTEKPVYERPKNAIY